MKLYWVEISIELQTLLQNSPIVLGFDNQISGTPWLWLIPNKKSFQSEHEISKNAAQDDDREEKQIQTRLQPCI